MKMKTKSRKVLEELCGISPILGSFAGIGMAGLLFGDTLEGLEPLGVLMCCLGGFFLPWMLLYMPLAMRKETGNHED